MRPTVEGPLRGDIFSAGSDKRKSETENRREKVKSDEVAVCRM
jgi:hypothetical protein